MVVLSDGRHSYIHKNESNASMLSRVIFIDLKSVHFLFLFSICSENKWADQLRSFFSHMQKAGFLLTRLISFKYNISCSKGMTFI